jgi:hypothetical protein
MPLRDHFHRPPRTVWQWQSLHSAWGVFMTEALNRDLLPAAYRAVPNLRLGSHAQVDVATVEGGAETPLAQAANGAVATAVWAPPKPAVVAAADFADLEVVQVEVRNDDEGYRLVAAVELVSPSNKDRVSHRHAFVSKCAAYLLQDVSVVVVDVVTERLENLHAELVDYLKLGDPARAAVTSELYAVAYRVVGREGGQKPRLEMWPEPLRVGAALPVLPLWIAPDQAVPLDLEASYTAACASLRIE